MERIQKTWRPIAAAIVAGMLLGLLPEIGTRALLAWQQSIQNQIDAARDSAHALLVQSQLSTIEILGIQEDADAAMVGVEGDEEADSLHELVTEAVAEAIRHHDRCQSIIEQDLPGQQGILKRLEIAEGYLPGNLPAASRQLRAATMYSTFANAEYVAGDSVSIEAESWLMALQMHLMGF